VSAPDGTDPSAECANCGHSPAYHADPSRPCYAWDPDRPDHKCACRGWKDKTPAAAAPAPAPTIEREETIEEMPWL
jgi:hypothetical protein